MLPLCIDVVLFDAIFGKIWLCDPSFVNLPFIFR
jgi:hypothetical protein